MERFVGTIELKFCPKCHKELIRLHRKKNAIIKPWQTHYYREYDYCPKCGHLQFYEQYKVNLKDGRPVIAEKPHKPETKKYDTAAAQYQPSPLVITKETNIGPDDGADLPWD